MSAKTTFVRTPAAALTSLLCLAMIFPGPGRSQSVRTATIYGSVSDSLSGTPLENVNVYIASSGVGTSTNSHGAYVLKHVPVGASTLVFSRVGASAKVVLLNVYGGTDIRQDARLHMRPIELGEVDVAGAHQKDWLNHLEEFKHAFLGDSWNAEQSTLINPEVLTFHYAEKGNPLTATSDRPLIVENNGLGFRVVVEIADFEWNLERGGGHFLTYPYFQPLLPRSSNDSTGWALARKRTYRGSFQQFLRALYNGRPEDAGFVIYRGGLEELRRGAGRFLYGNQISLELDSDSQGKRWAFDGWLRVEYEAGGDRIASYLHLLETPATIEPFGTVRNPVGIEILGQWSRARMADMLPIDFDEK